MRGVPAAIFFILLLLPVATATGQSKKTKIKLLNADNLNYDQTRYGKIRILQGNVRFKHRNVFLYCDSAALDPSSNSMYAYGKVKVEQPGKVVVTGDSMFFDGNTRSGWLRGNDRLKDAHQELTTNFIDFDLKKNVYYYSGGGKIVNNRDRSVLTSRQGYYYTESEIFFFKDSVVMTTPDYTIRSDTLQYDGKTEITRFHGPTTIVSDSSSIYCEKGWYDKLNKTSSFERNVVIESDDQILKGDSIVVDEKKQEGRAFGNVAIIDTANKISVYGSYATYNRKDSSSLITGHLLMEMAFEEDTLFLHSDTLRLSRDNSGKHREIDAFHHVKFFKEDMQGKCDSIHFSEADSTLKMFGEPVVWSDENQLTGVEIHIKTWQGHIENMFITEKAFIISREEEGMFNQIKGKTLLAKFRDNEIYRIHINRNAETIYFVREEDKSIMGMNRLECSDMTINILDNEIEDIRFYDKPKGTFYPPKDFEEQIMFFRYFHWRESERPQKKEDIFIWE